MCISAHTSLIIFHSCVSTLLVHQGDHKLQIMVYFKLLLNDKRLKSDNIYPIVVRVTYNRNNTTFITGIRVNSSQWDNTAFKIKHTHSNAQQNHFRFLQQSIKYSTKANRRTTLFLRRTQGAFKRKLSNLKSYTNNRLQDLCRPIDNRDVLNQQSRQR